MTMSKLLLAMSSVLMLAGLAAGCSPDVPANPTYTKDVASLLDAHCVRCHGADDMLHTLIGGSTRTPKYCYLQRYESEGDCTIPTAAACKNGASSPLCAPYIPSYLNLGPDTRMPPPPSEPLNDWEQEVLTRWVAHGAPQ